MKLIFAGTPSFAASALTALHAAGHEIACVFTMPDRPAGRGMKQTGSATGLEALRLGLPVDKPVSLKDPQIQERIKNFQPEVMVVAAYGLILPQAVLDIPRHGCLNIHGSLLPRWRGAAPVQRAIEAGDHETGINIMQMDAGLDTGPVLLEKRLAIEAQETSATLFEKLAQLGARAIVEALERLPSLTPTLQSTQGVTYAKKISRTESPIDWKQPAEVIERRLRAFDPFPGCETTLNGEALKIWSAACLPADQAVTPGTVTATSAHSITVRCGHDALALRVVQKPGGRRMAISEFLRGTPIEHGARLT